MRSNNTRGIRQANGLFGLAQQALKHLLETVTLLEERSIGFRSLQQAIDMTTGGGRLILYQRDLSDVGNNASGQPSIRLAYCTPTGATGVVHSRV